MLAGLATNAESDRFRLAMAASAEQSIARCMTDDGFRYTPKDPRSLVDVTTDTDFGNRAYARTYGFGVTAAPVFLTVDDPNVGYLRNMTPTRRATYQNHLSLCADSASRSVRKSSGEDTAGVLYATTDDQVRDDLRYRAAEDTWRRCTGHIAPTRTALINALQARRAATVPNSPAFHRLQDDERTAALSTYDCSQKLDLVYARLYEHYRKR